MTTDGGSWLFGRGAWSSDALIRLLFLGGESRSRRFVLDLFPGARPRRLLELGVGSGRNVAYYPPESCVVGVDLSAAMLGRARRRFEQRPDGRAELLRADAANLPCAAGTFDGVLLFLFLSQLVPHRAVLAEVDRVAAPGATIVVADHPRSGSRVLALLEHAADLLLRPLGLSLCVDVRALVEETGWRIARVASCPGTLSFLKVLVAEKRR